MDEAKSKFGTKGRTNAGLTLGIIGTALAAFAGNNGGCGCGNGGGILGNLFGGNNNCCAMQAAENAKTFTIMETAATSETITTLTPTVTKVIDVIIPNGVSIVSQQVLDELPTSLPVKGHCAYSVFDVRVTPAPAPTAAIASVAKSK